jgi:hypothetical protein
MLAETLCNIGWINVSVRFSEDHKGYGKENKAWKEKE